MRASKSVTRNSDFSAHETHERNAIRGTESKPVRSRCSVLCVSVSSWFNGLEGSRFETTEGFTTKTLRHEGPSFRSCSNKRDGGIRRCRPTICRGRGPRPGLTETGYNQATAVHPEWIGLSALAEYWRTIPWGDAPGFDKPAPSALRAGREKPHLERALESSPFPHFHSHFLHGPGAKPSSLGVGDTWYWPVRTVATRVL